MGDFRREQLNFTEFFSFQLHGQHAFPQYTTVTPPSTFCEGLRCGEGSSTLGQQEKLGCYYDNVMYNHGEILDLDGASCECSEGTFFCTGVEDAGDDDGDDDGDDGKDGEDGKEGEDGEDGEDGDDGED